MTLELVNPPELPTPRTYSHARRGHGKQAGVRGRPGARGRARRCPAPRRYQDHDHRREPENARFNLIIGEPGANPAGLLDYAIVQPAGHISVSYNSSRQGNSVRLLGAGRYELTLRGPRSRGVTGSVAVTPFGTVGTFCETAGWHGILAGEIVDVDCFAASGARHNEGFTVSYTRRANLTARPGTTSADAFANLPTTLAYEPATQDSSHAQARVVIVRQGKGQYLAIFAGSSGPFTVNGGDVQVTPVAGNDDRCIVDSWNQALTPEAFISCSTRTGARADSAFAVRWIVS